MPNELYKRRPILSKFLINIDVSKIPGQEEILRSVGSWLGSRLSVDSKYMLIKQKRGSGGGVREATRQTGRSTAEDWSRRSVRRCFYQFTFTPVCTNQFFYSRMTLGKRQARCPSNKQCCRVGRMPTCGKAQENVNKLDGESWQYIIHLW